MQASTTPSTLTIGIDLGDRQSHICVLDADGDVAEEGRIATTPKALRARFEGLASTRIALEVGGHSAWVSELLAEFGHEVIVANARMRQDLPERLEERPTRRRAAGARGANGLETPVPDRTSEPVGSRGPGSDAFEGRPGGDAHAAGEPRPRGAQVLRSSGQEVPGPRPLPSTPHRQVAEQIPEELKSPLQPLLDTLAAIAEKILGYDREIRRLSTEEYPETALLNQVGGVGPITALRYVLTIEDPKRIQSSRNVGSYLGLRPRQRQSGQHDPELRITKAGDRQLRCSLVQCAQQILGPFGKDCDLRRWGLELASRGGATAKKKAVIAVARKLAVLLHRLWLTGEVYEPLRNADRRAAARTSEPAAVAV